MTKLLVLGSKGCGSVIVEAALTLAGIPFDREETDYSTAAGRARLLPFNPLAQVPTVILPDGTVMTESLALIHHISELAPSAKLIPPVGDPLRPTALRYLTFLVSAIYPTFNYSDDPAKWVGDAGPVLKQAMLDQRQRLYAHLESVAKRPTSFLGVFSAIDLYLCAMTRWTPGREWFSEHAPKLHAISVAVDAHPNLAKLWAANF